MDLRLDIAEDTVFIFEFKFKKYSPSESIKKPAAAKGSGSKGMQKSKGRPQKIKTQDERYEDEQSDGEKLEEEKIQEKIIAQRMADAIKAARTQLKIKGYALKDMREKSHVYQVAVGIVGRSRVGAELV
jgi:hypothetical protein